MFSVHQFQKQKSQCTVLTLPLEMNWGWEVQVSRVVFSRVYFPVFPGNIHLTISGFYFGTSTVQKVFPSPILIFITSSCANYVNFKHSLQSYLRLFSSEADKNEIQRSAIFIFSSINLSALKTPESPLVIEKCNKDLCNSEILFFFEALAISW